MPLKSIAKLFQNRLKNSFPPEDHSFHVDNFILIIVAEQIRLQRTNISELLRSAFKLCLKADVKIERRKNSGFSLFSSNI